MSQTRSRYKFCKINSIETAFLAIAGLFGCLFVAIVPPFQVADEYLHFYRAFQISEGQWIAQQQTGDCYGYSQYFQTETCLGGKLPKSILTTVREVSSIDLRFHPERKQKIQEIFAVLNLPLNSQDRVFIKFNTTGLHAPIPYLPQAFGIGLGKLLNASPLILLYMGRLTNLAVWLVLSYLTLKTTPIAKLVFFLLLLTPMSLFQAASLSADALTNGLAFLSIAIILENRLTRHSSIQPKNYLKLFALSILLCLAKIAYFPILLLLCLKSVDPGETRIRSHLKILLIWLGGFLSILGWSSIVDRIYVPLSSGIFPDRQIEFVLREPLTFATTLVRTFSQQGLDYLHQFIGILGWIDTPLPWFLVGSYWSILILVSLLSGDAERALSSSQKLGIAGIFILNTMILSLLAYLWNPIGAKIIGGLQGRYFIPLSPLFFLLFYQKRTRLKHKKILRCFAILFAMFSSFLTAIVLIYRYYI